MKEQLYINNIYIPLSKSINPSITKAITDVANPDKRKATFTKTVNIPATPEINKVLGHIYDINTTGSSFDVTVKADCYYLVNDEAIFEDGYCQLKAINRKHGLPESYDFVIGGGIADLFGELGESELKDLADGSFTGSLDEWDHPLTKDIIKDSWSTQVYNGGTASFVPFALGTGYVYPLIDYGRTTQLDKWPYYEMPCAIYAKTYIDAISAYTGITFESTFFDSTYFKSWIIPSSPDNYQLTQTQITDRQVSANTPELTSTGTTTSGNINKGVFFSTPDTIIFSNELSDVSGIYDDTTGVITTSVTTVGNQTINALIDVDATFTPSTGASVACVSDIEGYFMVYVNGAQVQSQLFRITYDDYPTLSTGARSTSSTPTYPDTDYLQPASTPYSQSVVAGSANNIARSHEPPNRYLVKYSYYAQNGDTIEIKWKARYVGLNGSSSDMFIDGLNAFYDGDATIDISVGALWTKYENTYLSEGSTFEVQQAIPDKIKIKDFFMSICKAANLWVDVHPTKSKHLIVEPREDFYSSDILDIQEKLAHDKPLVYDPMAKLDASDYDFTYKSDKDELNTRYEGQYSEIYGRRRVVNQNDFVTKDKKTELVFSPTVLSAPDDSDMVISTIIGLDNTGQRKPIDHNIRLLYYGGLKSCSKVWGMNGGTGGNVVLSQYSFTTYPYAGHFDDPYNATEDLNFGLVKEVYYQSQTATPISVNNSNLYNKYYSKMLAEYTDKDSKIVTGWFNINPADFKQWTFDKLYYFNNAYFRLQKINGYNPTNYELTKCEFLYLVNAPEFEAQDLDLDGDKPPVTGPPFGSLDVDETKPVSGGKGQFFGDGNTAYNKSQKVNGEFNYVSPDAYYIDINGDSNTVQSGAKNVLITGDGNTIGSGFENITLINTDNLEVFESDVAYINGIKIEPSTISSNAVVTVTAAAYPATTSERTILCDTTSNDIEIELPSGTNDGQTWFIKKMVAANTLTVIAAGGETIDGSTTITITRALETMKVTFGVDEDNYSIT